MTINHYRLRITGSASGTNVAVAELLLRATAAGADFAATGAATADTEDGVNVAGNAVDATASTFWRSTAATGVLSVALASANTAVEYVVQAAPTATDAPTSWALEASADGVNWYTVDRRNGQSFTDGEEKTFAITAYRIPGTVTEEGTGSPLARRVIAFDYATGTYKGEATSDAGTGQYEIAVQGDDAVLAVSVENYGQRWRSAEGYSIGDRVFPTTGNGHWYEAEAAGTSAASEPVWPTDGSTIIDGGVTWRDQGDMEAPRILAPFIPVE